MEGAETCQSHDNYGYRDVDDPPLRDTDARYHHCTYPSSDQYRPM